MQQNSRSNRWISWTLPGAIAMVGLALNASGAFAQSVPDAGSRPVDAGVAMRTPDAGAPRADSGSSAQPQYVIAADPAAYTGPAPYFSLGMPRLNNTGTTPTGIQRVVNRQKEGIVSCYKRFLAVHSTAQGQLQLHFDIIAGGSGLIDRVHMTPHRNTSFENCVRDVISAWSWANPRGVPSVTIDLAIELAPTPPARPTRGR